MKDFLSKLCGFTCAGCFLGLLGVVGNCERGRMDEAQCLAAGLACLAGMAILYMAAFWLSNRKEDKDDSDKSGKRGKKR